MKLFHSKPAVGPNQMASLETSEKHPSISVFEELISDQLSVDEMITYSQSFREAAIFVLSHLFLETRLN
jgi:hypothetical protein